MLTDIVSHLPWIALAPIGVGLTGLALCGLVAAVEWAERRLRIRRAMRAYRRHVAELERRQFLSQTDYARCYGPYARRTDHQVVSFTDRRRS